MSKEQTALERIKNEVAVDHPFKVEAAEILKLIDTTYQ